jgi:hypothetical protein
LLVSLLLLTNGAVGVYSVPFAHDVAGGPAVSGFPAVEDVFAVASIPAGPGVSILAGCFTYWIVEWDYYTIILSDYGFRIVILFCY